MPTVRLLYSSISTMDETDKSALVGLVSQANAYNRTRNITGELLLRHGEFMQVLEGRRGEILELFERIRNDPRHRSITLMHFGEISSRSFFNWRMNLIRWEEIPSDVNVYLVGHQSFSLAQLSSEEATSLLLYCWKHKEGEGHAVQG